jgi:hypothetical protein
MINCQVEGCPNKAVTVESLNKIHQGICLSNAFFHCKAHTPEQLRKAIGEYQDQLVSKMCKVNPFVEVRKVANGLGKAAG